jgi:quinoprotein glucose dehydrogenase
MFRAYLLALVVMILSCNTRQSVDWPIYGGTTNADRYSKITQIDTSNVNQLEVAWTYRTGDNDSLPADFQCHPIIVNGVMYLTSPKVKLIALNAATGEELWKFDPFENREPEVHASRGVVYWESGNLNDGNSKEKQNGNAKENEINSRILFTASDRLYAINASNGQPILSFGDSGYVDLHEGLGEGSEDLYVVATTPGIVYKNLLILGTRVSEGYDAAPGNIRAFNIVTGKLEWNFATLVPNGDSTAKGGANAWAGFSLDPENDMVFVPTGSAAYDFYGADRPGENLYANSIIALKASTGKYIWHYQTVHHDLWDRDLPCQPVLLTVNHNRKKIPALAQATKTGFIFLLDRMTGKPLFPVEERAVPVSDLPDERSWPTQPFPLKPEPFTRQIFREEDVTDISKNSHDSVLKVFKTVRSEGQFVPPSFKPVMMFPGFDGGAEWGGLAADPRKGILYINANEMPWILTMVDGNKIQFKGKGERLYIRNCASCHGADKMGDQHNFPSLVGIEKKYRKQEIEQIVEHGRGRMPGYKQLKSKDRASIVSFIMNEKENQNEVQIKVGKNSSKGDKANGNNHPANNFVSTGYNRFFDPEGYPAVKPPWGTLNAVDMNTGEYLWKVPLGEFDSLTQRGIPPTGTENYGGPVLTASGVLFISATKDKMIRAFNAANGKVLWKYKLPAGGYATPSTYMVNGKQYVVITAGGVKMRSEPGDYVIAFALPEKN